MDRDGLMIASDGDCSPQGGSDTERVISRCANALGTYAQPGFLSQANSLTCVEAVDLS